MAFKSVLREKLRTLTECLLMGIDYFEILKECAFFYVVAVGDLYFGCSTYLEVMLFHKIIVLTTLVHGGIFSWKYSKF